MAKCRFTSKFTGCTCGISAKVNLKNVNMPVPTAAPMRTSEATCGSRQRPASTRFQVTIECGQRARTAGSSARYTRNSTAAAISQSPAPAADVFEERDADHGMHQPGPCHTRQHEARHRHAPGALHVGAAQLPVPPRQQQHEEAADDTSMVQITMLCTRFKSPAAAALPVFGRRMLTVARVICPFHEAISTSSSVCGIFGCGPFQACRWSNG